MERHYRHSGPEINELLRKQVMGLCRALGLDGRLQGSNYWVKDPRRRDGGNYTSFSIETRRGFYKDFSTGEGGDLIHLVAIFMCNGDNAKAIRWAQDWLGIGGGSVAPSPHEAAALVAARRKEDEQEAERIRHNKTVARKIWLDALPLDGKDPASLYLLRRGIDVMALPGGPPRALRYTMDCLANPENQRLPAMLANMSGRGGQVATHRTYLDFSGGIWVKAFRGQVRDGRPVSPKRVLGRYAGASIRLTRGKSGKVLAEAPVGEWIVIAEGIENALTAAQARPDLRCLSSGAGPNLGGVELPLQIAGVYLVADNDREPGAIAALGRAMDKYAERGIEPVAVRASDGFKDFNDYLTGVARG